MTTTTSVDPAPALRGLDRLATLPRWLLGPDTAALSHALTSHGVDLPGPLVGSTQRVRMRTGYWEARYRVEVSTDQGVQVVDFVGEMRPPGAPHDLGDDAIELPEFGVALRRVGQEPRQANALDDPGLPALAGLLDPVGVVPVLEQVLHAANPAYAGARIATCEPRVMRYKPGARCTNRYDLTYQEPTAAPSLMISKTYRGSKGEIAWRGMSELWNSSMATSDTVAIAEPLGFDAVNKVLYQGPVPGERTLKELLAEALRSRDPGAIEHVGRLFEGAADGLAAMHRCDAGADETLVFDDERDDAYGAWARLTAMVPELGGATDELFALIDRLAAGTPADPVAPCHRSFRPAQILVTDDDRLGFIDFDGYCLAEPACDVALMRATIRCYGASVSYPAGSKLADELPSRLAILDAWCEAFTQRYRASAQVSAERVAAWELVESFVHLQNSWTKSRPGRPATTLPVLRALAAPYLDA